MTCPSKSSIKHTSAIVIICPTQSNHISPYSYKPPLSRMVFIDHRKSSSIALEIILPERYLLIQ